ncbi:MAG: glycosyltransferase family 9 protein [Opitutales bacterium]|nr:glycosyltransferase family 9 protein [Opitutales bacterium]
MKILVFRTGQLGDSLAAVPAIHAIHRTYPKANKTLLYDQHIGKSYVLSRALFAGSHLFDRFLPYPVPYQKRDKTLWPFHLFRLLWILRRQKFDLVIHLEPELKTPARLKRDKLFFRLAGIPRQVTTLPYRKPRSCQRPLQPLEHESDFYLRALGTQGFTVPPPGQGSYNLNLTPTEDKEVKSFWHAQKPQTNNEEQRTKNKERRTNNEEQRTKNKQQPSTKLISVAIGSKMQSKRWPLERFAAVLTRLHREYGLTPLFLGGPEDAEASAHLIEKLGCGFNACGSLSLRGSARAMEGTHFYLGNDTGTMHLAVAVGLKCVAIFSARDVPGKWYPYGEGHKVHRIPVDCEGCLLYECHQQKRKCLTSIAAEDVFESCVEVMNDRNKE